MKTEGKCNFNEGEMNSTRRFFLNPVMVVFVENFTNDSLVLYLITANPGSCLFLSCFSFVVNSGSFVCCLSVCLLMSLRSALEPCSFICSVFIYLRKRRRLIGTTGTGGQLSWGHGHLQMAEAVD